MNTKHTPVMEHEVMEALKVESGKRYIDGTAGQLGHFNKIRELGGTVLGLEYDADQIAHARSGVDSSADARLVLGNFADIESIAKHESFIDIDGVLLDLGISYRQLAAGGKGLSYKNDTEPLDMRLISESQSPAVEILATASEDELYTIFARFSEEPLSQRIAHAVVLHRVRTPIRTVRDLKSAIDSVVKTPDTHVYSRIFQALRMYINNELENLKRGFVGALQILKSGGVLVIITFQSLEDRVVKQLIRANHDTIAEDWKVKKKQARSFERSAIVRVIRKK